MRKLRTWKDKLLAQGHWTISSRVRSGILSTFLPWPPCYLNKGMQLLNVKFKESTAAVPEDRTLTSSKWSLHFGFQNNMAAAILLPYTKSRCCWVEQHTCGWAASTGGLQEWGESGSPKYGLPSIVHSCTFYSFSCPKSTAIQKY